MTARRLIVSSSFAFALVKVSNNATLLGNPNLTELYTNALHIGLWNSIENDFVLIAASLPSVPPVFVACTRFTGTKLSFRSLKSRPHHIPLEEHKIARNGQLPGSTDQVIHVNYDFSLQRERAGSEGTSVPTYNFIMQWSGRGEVRTDWPVPEHWAVGGLLAESSNELWSLMMDDLKWALVYSQGLTAPRRARLTKIS